MANHRRPTMPPSMSGESRAGWCRWCGEEIKDSKGQQVKRLRWHPGCVTIYRVACFSGDQRAALFTRDKGVCQQCGVDTERLERRLTYRDTRWVPDWQTYYRRYGRTADYQEPFRKAQERYHKRRYLLIRLLEERQARMEALGWPRFRLGHYRTSGHALWHADHIKPLIESEGRIEYFLLENLTTLCCICHKAKTKREAALRAQQRKQASQNGTSQ